MGTGHYSGLMTRCAVATSKSTGVDMFDYHHKLRETGQPLKVHKSLDPKEPNQAGRIVRESRDSEDHPESLPIAILLDVTGSMRDTPRVFIEKLPNLMELLLKPLNGKPIVADPHILFGAIGDAEYDAVPIQVGQFEADNRIDEAIKVTVLEGGGGGQIPPTESYDLAAYFLAEHAELDSLDKRGKKGYCFFVGDELPFKKTSRKVIRGHIGDTPEADIPCNESFEKLREKFEVYWIFPGGTSHFKNPIVNSGLLDLFGQNLKKLNDPANVCELIALTIATAEGASLEEAKAALAASGSSVSSIDAAEAALGRVRRSGFDKEPVGA